ncbi:MAG: tRNA lysidine(34) synthetase TilS [Clostridia bacterium]
MFTKSIINSLQQYKRLALAVSGGMDSMALLCSFLENRAFLNNFFVINIEHGIRGENSIKDSQFVKDFCGEHNVECKIVKIDTLQFCKESGFSIEQGARKLRHEVFNQLITNGEAEKIVTAHHLDDNAETLLMHIFRGSGVKGLIGMSFEDGNLLRPFINFSKAEIIEYQRQKQFSFVTDETNKEIIYTRNFVREKIVPQINSIYPKYKESLMRLSTLSAEIDDFTRQECDKYITCKGDKIFMKIEALSLHSYLAKATIKQCFERLGVMYDIESRHLNIILNINVLPNGASVDMPFDTIVSKEYDFVVFSYKQKMEIVERSFDANSFDFGEDYVTIVKVDRADYSKEGQFVDGNKLINCVVRARKSGDKFTKFGGKTKLLNDYFTDKKVPKRLRDLTPIIARGNEVLVVVGVEIADAVKIDEKTKNILFIQLRRKNYARY